MNRLRDLFILVGVLLMTSCNNEEMRQEDNAEERAIRFETTELKVLITKAIGENTDKRIFLGIAGKDSLFLTASESDITTVPAALTKSSTANIPESFHLSTFKDAETSPYLSHKLTSSDGWQTYSPTLYWPVVYQHIHFFAHTYDFGENPITPVHSVTDGYSTRFTYVTPHSETGSDDALVQPDLTVAISTSQRESDKAVELKFVHTLSAVEFRVGEIGEATVGSSVAKLCDVFSAGTCTVSAPVSAETISWTTTDELATYSQTIQEGTEFKMIPQEFTDSDASFEIILTVGDVVHNFSGIKLNEITSKWKPNTKYIYTVTKGGEVKVDVRTQKQSTYLNNIKIQNTGFTNAYIRASVIGYWYVVRDGIEEVAASWEITDQSTGVLQMPSDWASKWVLKEGIYYYKDIVEPGGYTTPLFESYELTKTAGPIAGSKLNISIAAQAIESEKGKDFWPIDQQ